MKRPVLTAAAAVSSLLAGSALAQTTRDYAAIYGVRSGASAQLSPQQDVATTVGTGPASRYAKPQPGAERAERNMQPRGTGRDFGYSDYGTVSGGYPVYGSREFPAPLTPAQQQAQAEAQASEEEEAPAEEAAQQEGEQQAEGEEEFAVSEGFFFDNYTSGTGFGVYGGEAVSSGQGSPLILPSAGNRAQELGFQTGTTPGGTGNGGGAGGEEPDPET